MTTITGTRKRVTGTFTLDGTNTDPGAVTVTVLSPDGVTSTVEATKNGTGIYYADVDLTDPGPWVVRFVGTSPVVAAAETTVLVDASAFYPTD